MDPSPIIACVGLIDDVRDAVTMNLKGAGNSIYLIGPRFDELGGSEYYRTVYGVIGKNVPVVRFDLERNMIYAVIDSIAEELVVSAHDISNGGLGATAAEMALAGRGDLGMKLDLDSASSDLSADRLVFSESSGFLLECKEGAEEDLEKLLKGCGLAIMKLGKVTGSPEIVMAHGGKTVLRMDLSTAKKAWTGGLTEAMR